MPHLPCSTPLRVAVIGGGISGLAAAHRLVELDPTIEVALFEAGNRLGGIIETQHVDGFLLERSADSFIGNPPYALDLCRRIGFESQLIGTREAHRAAYVVHRGRLVKLPEGFTLLNSARLWPLVRTPLLSWRGKLRLAAEALIGARRADTDESFARFARRRLGPEAYERLAQPLVAGIYTADPEKLSMQAALPRFVDMEQRYGSLYRGMRHELKTRGALESGARYGLFVTPRQGLSSLIDALAARLPQGCVRLNQTVNRITREENNRWSIHIHGDSSPWTCDAVIVAVASHYAASLLRTVDSRLAHDLERIEYAGCVIALTGYRREDIAHPLDAFGFVVPEVEGRPILAGSFASVKFEGRAPREHVLLRIFIGGAMHADLHELDDAQIRHLVQKELVELLGTRGEPVLFRVARWNQAMPQYHVGHVELVDCIERRVSRLPNLALAGSAYRGVGIPHCVQSGETAAERIVAGLHTRQNVATAS
jgi:oxygen-dependent protoporphyrinogen oxidase